MKKIFRFKLELDNEPEIKGVANDMDELNDIFSLINLKYGGRRKR